jgi:hypothetical protein
MTPFIALDKWSILIAALTNSTEIGNLASNAPTNKLREVGILVGAVGNLNSFFAALHEVAFTDQPTVFINPTLITETYDRQKVFVTVFV